MSQALHEMQESGQQPDPKTALQQSLPAAVEAAAPGERELLPNSSRNSPGCIPTPFPSPLLQGDAGSYEHVSQGQACTEQELPQLRASSNQELSDCHKCNKQELSIGESRSYAEFSRWQECLKQELSHGEIVESPTLSDWEESSEQELWHKEVGCFQEVSDWEESIGQELCKEEDSVGQEVPKGNGNRPSVQSNWEDDSEQEPELDNWEGVTALSMGLKALLWEDDEWGEVSSPELFEEARQPTLGGFAGDGLPVQVPRDAWLEQRALEPCPQGPLWAWPRHEEGQALSQQLGPCKKRLSRFRQALQVLRSLFRWPCLLPQQED